MPRSLACTLASVPAEARADGPPGNRAVGVIYEKILTKTSSTSSASAQATVAILNRAAPEDSTNVDGVYYLVVPADLTEFALVAKKTGYQAGTSSNYRNDKDPIKADRITLEPLNAKAPNIRQIVDEEIRVLRLTASKTVQRLILTDLTKLLAEVVAPTDKDYIARKLGELPSS